MIRSAVVGVLAAALAIAGAGPALARSLSDDQGTGVFELKAPSAAAVAHSTAAERAKTEAASDASEPSEADHKQGAEAAEPKEAEDAAEKAEPAEKDDQAGADNDHDSTHKSGHHGGHD